MKKTDDGSDPNCDMGPIANENGFGVWAPSNDVEAFTQTVDKMLAADRGAMGEKGYQFFLDNYTVEHTYGAIMQHLTTGRFGADVSGRMGDCGLDSQ